MQVLPFTFFFLLIAVVNFSFINYLSIQPEIDIYFIIYLFIDKMEFFVECTHNTNNSNNNNNNDYIKKKRVLIIKLML